ncbi:GvpL/GvpF family gas vesicle protein [Streptosporangium sp. NBC_01756]|uniref:GvpL/GvpF family gas vesicle protein n=1 Tax=Streptosporangium sp. NBC_01756 TaxID=2975950 RepID=UPI002DDC05D1|nr:GvpL/GvpF family gas vesicle protein [Streptosporangium sp. NBC_01756]WSC87920.1 GvpL/GvpF family gas vesicle protein [Streptosporangium sp. NBC_01756]
MPGSTSRTRTAGTEEATRRKQDSGSYIYGIVPADVELSPDARGIGDPPGRIRLVRHGRLAALISEVTLDRPLGRPNDLIAHQQLLDGAAAEVPVLPLRFGAVVTGPEAVVDELLRPYHDEFLAALNELEGRVEYVVKGRYVEHAVIGEVLAENPEAARLREEIHGRPAEATWDARIRLGELVGEAVAAKRAADTDMLVDALAPRSVAVVVREPTHEQDAVHVAFLIENDQEAEFRRIVEKFGKQWTDRVALRLLGPLAPYDFVMTRRGEE